MKKEKTISSHWNNKIKKAVLISKKYDYTSYNFEFWMHQPAGVISLLLDVYKSKCKKHKEF